MNDQKPIEQSGASFAPSTLLCCPWCGVLPQIKKGWLFGWDVECLKCKAWPTRKGYYKTADAALAVWNDQRQHNDPDQR